MPTQQDIKKATKAVADYKEGDTLGKGTKYLEDGKTLQKRIGDTLRVWFTPKKEIIKIFHKENHKSHR